MIHIRTTAGSPGFHGFFVLSNELAERYGATAINIAAAYVLSQPFPSFALIGPRKLKELHTSLPALQIELSEQERAYLDLRSDELPA